MKNFKYQYLVLITEDADYGRLMITRNLHGFLRVILGWKSCKKSWHFLRNMQIILRRIHPSTRPLVLNVAEGSGRTEGDTSEW